MTPGPKMRIAWQGFFTGALFLFYAGTFKSLSDGRILGNDAIPYALSLSRGAGSTQPHHLLFHPVAALFYKLIGPLGGAGTSSPLGLAMTAQVLTSALGGALAALFFFRVARRCLGSRARDLVAATALTAALAFSAGHWLYASVGETYLPAIAAEIATLGLCIRERLADSSNRRPHLAMIILALLCAVLLRQDSVLVVVAVALLLPLRRALVAIGTTGILALVLYLAAYSQLALDESFNHWLRGLANSGLWGGTFGPSNLKIAGTLTLTALAYPLWYASQGWLHGELGKQFPALLMGLAPWLLLIAGARAARHQAATPAGSQRRRVVLALIAFALLRFGFFAWWQPGNMEYHTGTLTPLFLALAVWTGGRESEGNTAGLWTFAALLVIAGNTSSLIGPNQSEEMDRRARVALETASPAGLALSLDTLGHYAMQRARGTSTMPAADRPTLVNATSLANGSDRAGVSKLIGQIQSTLDNGHRVVAIRDQVLPKRFKHAAWFLDQSPTGNLALLLEDFTAEPGLPDQGMDSYLWLIK